MAMYSISRIYEPPGDAEEYRVLVDRLWPRGVTKVDAALDEWCKDIAPSSGLRTRWNHNPQSFEDFAERYRAELDENTRFTEIADRLNQHPRVTLLYGARDPEVNHAVILRNYLTEYSGPRL